MQQRTLRAFILLIGTFVLLISTATAALSAERSPIQQANTPDATPLTQEALEQFWQEMYPSEDLAGIADHTPGHTNVYTTELLAKASPDECFDGLESQVFSEQYPSGFSIAQIECMDGAARVQTMTQMPVKSPSAPIPPSSPPPSTRIHRQQPSR